MGSEPREVFYKRLYSDTKGIYKWKTLDLGCLTKEYMFTWEVTA